MVQPMGGLPWATDVTPAAISAANTSNSTSTPASSQPAGESAFAEQLAAAISSVLSQSGNGSQYEINIQTGQGADANQVTITVTDNDTASSSSAASSTPAPATPAPATTAPAPASPASAAASASSSTSSASSPSASASTSSANWTPPTFTPAQLATMTPADVYWAEQPPAVQQLRYMEVDERASYAQTLAAEGYTIDVPIMVDGGDPLAVMIQREIEGYTWVPSALQSNIPAGPGIDDPGVPSYDPNDPPPGSIMVSTAFALGTNLQDPVVSPQDMQTYVLDQAGASSTSTNAA